MFDSMNGVGMYLKKRIPGIAAAVMCCVLLSACAAEQEEIAETKTSLPTVAEHSVNETVTSVTEVTEKTEKEDDLDSETVSAGDAASSQTEPVGDTSSEAVTSSVSETLVHTESETTSLSETVIQETTVIDEDDIEELATQFTLPETELPDPQTTEPEITLPMYEKDFFSEDLFIGDSISTGYSLYGFLNAENVFAKVGLNPSSVLTKAVDTVYGQIGIADMLAYRNPKRVYIMLGSNGIQWLSIEGMLKSTNELTTLINDTCPDAQVVIVSVPPVTPKYDDTVPDVDVMSKIDEYNVSLKGYCNVKNYIFVDAASCLKDSTGYFHKDYAESDGMHFKAAAYKVLLSKIQSDVTEYEEKNAVVTEPAEVNPEELPVSETESVTAETFITTDSKVN